MNDDSLISTINITKDNKITSNKRHCPKNAVLIRMNSSQDIFNYAVGSCSPDYNSRNLGKRAHCNGSETDESEGPPEKQLIQEYAIRISLIDSSSSHNFIDLNWGKVSDYLDTVTGNWKFLAFGSEHKSVIVNGSTQEDTELLINIKQIHVDDAIISVGAQLLKSGLKKGIMFNKILINIQEEKISSILANYGIKEYRRLSKGLSFDGSKKYTGSIIISVENELPSVINVSKIGIPVNTMSSKPMMCSHCGILGHTNAKCSKKESFFCHLCFYDHSPDSECLLHCKQCQGKHFSFDPTCKVMIREMQILGIKESHDINYFDAKAMVSIMNPTLVLSSLDSARIRIQELTNRNEVIFDAGKQQLLENSKLIAEIQDKDEKIESMETEIQAKDEKIESIETEMNKMSIDFSVELDKLTKDAELRQQQMQEHMNSNSRTMNELKALNGKYNVLQDALANANSSISELQTEASEYELEKERDAKYVQEFVNSSQVVCKAFLNFQKKQHDHILSFEVNITRNRSTSKDRITFKETA